MAVLGFCGVVCVNCDLFDLMIFTIRDEIRLSESGFSRFNDFQDKSGVLIENILL